MGGSFLTLTGCPAKHKPLLVFEFLGFLGVYNDERSYPHRPLLMTALSLSWVLIAPAF